MKALNLNTIVNTAITMHGTIMLDLVRLTTGRRDDFSAVNKHIARENRVVKGTYL